MEIPADIESYRDRLWRREESLKVVEPADAEALIDHVGFCLGLTDARTPLPSLYIAVCGRRDTHMPRNVQKDPEASSTWLLKDDLMRRGNVYYSKLLKGKATFVSRRLIPAFDSVFGIPVDEEEDRLSKEALQVVRVLREEWESSTADLRADTGIEERRALTKALEDLQRAMKVVPYEVLYEPRFTYLWTLAEERFPEELSESIPREDGVRLIAEAFLKMCGMTFLGDLSRATGLKRKEAGAANHRLVDEGVAERVSRGVYRLKNLSEPIQ